MSRRSVDPAMKRASTEVSTLMGFKNLNYYLVVDNGARKKLSILQIKLEQLKHLLPRK